MKKTFFLYPTNKTNYLESIDTGNLFSLGMTELQLLKQADQTVFNILDDNSIFKKEHDYTNYFSGMILVNNYCNLQCEYCFEKDQPLNKTVLNNKLLVDISKLIKKDNDVTFTGGEPLLDFDKIKKICNIIEANDFNASYSIITNGLLLNNDSLIYYMDQRNFHIQVSLDGTISKNNKKINRTNKSIEDCILKNMIHALDISQNLSFTLRINFNRSSIYAFKEKIDYILSVISNYIDRIEIDMAIVDLPTNSPEYVSIEEKIETYEFFYLYLLQKKIKLPARYINGGNCMAKNKHIVLLDSNGYRYPCFSFVGNKSFKIDNAESYYNNLSNCSNNCDLYDICMGGCIYENFCETGKTEGTCVYQLLLQLNKKLFMYKLIELGYITFDELEDFDHVETFSVNF